MKSLQGNILIIFLLFAASTSVFIILVHIFQTDRKRAWIDLFKNELKFKTPEPSVTIVTVNNNCPFDLHLEARQGPNNESLFPDGRTTFPLLSCLFHLLKEYNL